MPVKTIPTADLIPVEAEAGDVCGHCRRPLPDGATAYIDPSTRVLYSRRWHGEKHREMIRAAVRRPIARGPLCGLCHHNYTYREGPYWRCPSCTYTMLAE